MKRWPALLLLVAASVMAQQNTQMPITCDEGNGCAHQFVNGQKFKILTGDGFTVTAAVRGNAKYLRVDVSVVNNSATSVDILPTTFSVDEVTPKDKSLAYVDPQKIMQSIQRRTAWSNALTAMGAGMQREQSTTNTTNMGTVNISASDGTSATGTYNGSATSTTSKPDYAAQARADEAIRERNAQVATLNGNLSRMVLRANTVAPNQSVSGFVIFESDKKVKSLILSIPIGSVVFKFPFAFLEH